MRRGFEFTPTVLVGLGVALVALALSLGGASPPEPRELLPGRQIREEVFTASPSGVLGYVEVTGAMTCRGSDLRLELSTPEPTVVRVSLTTPRGRPVRGLERRPVTLSPQTWWATVRTACGGGVEGYRLEITR